MLRELWDAFCEWASEAWNWTRNFFQRVWERIVSWWNAMCELIEDWLEDDDDEAVIIDDTSSIGSDIYREICRRNPNRQSVKRYNKQALHFDSKTGELKEVANFGANSVNERDDFERDLQRNNGILRLTN